jgi:hypothetical protein
MGTLDGKPVASWIVVRLEWARAQGWRGHVVSGFRTFAEQKQLHDEFLSGARPGPVARPGTSNHQGHRWPRGAVDVTEPEALAKILEAQPSSWKPLRPFGPGDLAHFSATGG